VSAALDGRTALVTGGSRGIGLAIARELAAAGCELVVNGLESAPAARSICQEIQAVGGRRVAFDDADLLRPGAARQLAATAIGQLGRIDILVNNAGIQHVAPVESFDERAWDRIIELNLSVPFRLTRALLPAMRAGGFGRVVNIASVHGLVASAGKAAYVAAKHGLVGLTRTVALETAAEPITCNAVCPGYARTELIEAQLEARARAAGVPVEDVVHEFLAEKQPSLSFVETTDIGRMVVFLCSDSASQITGAALTIDGGWSAR
jgi:3-hydroxybutyrate dehydrogenase